MKRSLTITLVILAITAGFASARSEDANSPKSEDKKEVSVSASEHAKHCSKNMKGNSGEAAKVHLQKGKSAGEK